MKVQKPPILPIIVRVLTLFTALILCAAGAFTWWANGISWIYDSGNDGAIPLLTCPQDLYSFAGTVPLGGFCHLSVRADRDLRAAIAESGLGCTIPINREDAVECNLSQDCPSVCQMQDGSGVCRSGEQPDVMCKALLGFTRSGPFFVDLACNNLLYGSYCESGFRVTASNSLAMRGILFGAFFMSFLWLCAELVLRRADIELGEERARGMARMAEELPTKRAILRKSLEERWRMRNAGDDFRSEYEASSVASPGIKDAENAEVPASFTSSSWRRRVLQWQRLRSEKSYSFRTKEFVRSVFLNFFFIALLTSTFYLILLISPQNLSVSESWHGGLVGKMKIWTFETWVDYFIFADVVVDTGIFLLATLGVKWPKSSVFSRHIQEQISTVVNALSSRQESIQPAIVSPPSSSSSSLYNYSESTISSSATVSFILNQSMSSDTCLLIACHLSCMTIERCETFSNTLKAAMAVFPPSHIFVCDNGPWLQPQDETQFVAKQVHPEINYVYIPEGNKTFAFYWTNKNWIPLLQRRGIVPNFTYALIIDDDVPLPPDLHIPHEHLKKNIDIKAVHFPITAATRNNLSPNLLVKCQDVEYKLAAVHKLFQASLARALSCHGAIALWDRQAMAEVLLEHDTVFNGEDLYMGLCLLRKRDSSKIISCAQTIVPTYAPDSWAVLFRQRVKSWELTSHKKTFTFLVEIINPVSFIHIPSLILKPYFVQELLTILLDWLRIFLLIGLLLRDTLGLLLMTAFFTLVLHVQLVLFQFVVLRDRPDLRSSPLTILIFPFYKLCNLFFRVCALCQNLLVYSHERKGIKLSLREDEIRDLPPLPPHHLVDWFTIWHEPETLINEKHPKRSRRSSFGQTTPRRFRM